MLVYTHKEHPQLAHVDLSTSIFVPNKKLGFIMHLPISAEGMWIRIWERDGVARVDSTGYLLHIPFGSVLFLRSDIVHSGIFGSPGNLRLHCAFQPVANPGDSAKLLPVDPTAGNCFDFGNLSDVLYSRCRHPEEKELASIPLVRDQESLFFREIKYLQDYKFHAASRCKDASGYSDLLPEKSPEASKSNPAPAAKPSPEELAKASGSTPTLAVKPPPDNRKKASMPKRANKKARV